MSRRLILASASPRRRELLAGLGVPFEVVVAEVTEHEESSTDPRTMVAHNAALKAEGYYPEGAKKLLAEAGYPKGFALTVAAPNNRYINDEQVAQAVAQMLARVGIATRVEALPINVYLTKMRDRSYSFATFAQLPMAARHCIFTWQMPTPTAPVMISRLRRRDETPSGHDSACRLPPGA